MHDGCTGTFDDGQAVVNKVRMMGFSQGRLPEPLRVPCRHCGQVMEMITFEFSCPGCGAVHAVTPCHAFSAEYVQCAGPGY